MNRRDVLRSARLFPLLTFLRPKAARAAPTQRRLRPSDAGWPAEAEWGRLARRVGGRLERGRSPVDACRREAAGSVCRALFGKLRNPYFICDQAGLTQTSGWVGAWTSSPSAYVVRARTTSDVVAAVNFARENRLRLVVKGGGGGHSYQGTSSAPDSLLIWTRDMDSIALHDDFVPAGCAKTMAPQPAVTLGPGAIWMHVYDAVTTRGGRYVQGGGCATVGVAGLVQSGGFGSFSKRFGLAAAGLLEAEVVTADGEVRIANACSHPDLFWGLKGGGGGSLGVVTRLTLRTHDLPQTFGLAFGSARASSDAAFRRLIRAFLDVYAENLFNPHWGEAVTFRPDNVLELHMVFQDLRQEEAEAAWKPFMDRLAKFPGDVSFAPKVRLSAFPARRFWDPNFLEAHAPGLFAADDRPGASPTNIFYVGDQHEAGQYIFGYDSLWLPADLLEAQERGRLADALFTSSRHWEMSLHFNKGLAGAPAQEIAAARDAATNPAALSAFALAICGAVGPAAFPGVADHEPDLALARGRAESVRAATRELSALVPAPGSYVSESNYFNADWRRAFWGDNYERLLAVKHKYDPDGLFFVHHGVGSEAWSADGFTRLAAK